MATKEFPQISRRISHRDRHNSNPGLTARQGCYEDFRSQKRVARQARPTVGSRLTM